MADASSGPWSDIPDRLGPSALSYTYSTHALTGGTRKYFRIRALTGDDASDWSRVVQATTLRASVPGAPRSVSAQAQGTDVIVVSWNAPSSDGGSPITQYEVQWHDRRRQLGDTSGPRWTATPTPCGTTSRPESQGVRLTGTRGRPTTTR